MAIAVNAGVVHMPFGERPQYGTPYPLGIAVAHATQTGDATGGAITLTVQADPGFLYRLEMFRLERGTSVLVNMDTITAHAWAQARSGFPVGSFDLNWVPERLQANTFAVYDMVASRNSGPGPIEAMKRFPMGRLAGAPGVAQLLAVWNVTSNVDTITHEWQFVATYWDRQALYLPGFLSSFFAAPEVPTQLKVGA